MVGPELASASVFASAKFPLLLLELNKRDERDGTVGSAVSSTGDSIDDTVDPSKAESRLFSRVFKRCRITTVLADDLAISDVETLLGKAFPVNIQADIYSVSVQAT